MNAVSVMCSVLACLLLAGELRWVLALQSAFKRISGLDRQLVVTRVRQQEYALLQESKAQMALVQGVAEQLIDSTTQTTRETHQRIADVPFTVFESIPATRDAAKAARGVHDITSTSVYAAVSLLNKGVGKGLRELMKTESAETKKPERLEKGGPGLSDKDDE